METAAGAKESVESTVSESLHSKFVFITVITIRGNLNDLVV